MLTQSKTDVTITGLLKNTDRLTTNTEITLLTYVQGKNEIFLSVWQSVSVPLFTQNECVNYPTFALVGCHIVAH